MNKEIYILMPVYNRKKITLEFVKDLKNQTTRNFKLVLIDDGSSDGTSEDVKSELPSSIILKTPGSFWWAGCLQLSIDYLKDVNIAKDTPILIINDDTILPDDFLEIGLKHLLSSPKTLVCAQNYINGQVEGTGVHIDWKLFRFSGTEDKDKINCLPTRGLFLFFEDILKIGEFKPRILPHYLSDYEFTYRAYRKGYNLACPLNLYLSPMPQETGIRDVDQVRGWKYLKTLFSMKCVSNPIYLLNFILIASPLRFKARSSCILLISIAKGIMKNVFLPKSAR